MCSCIENFLGGRWFHDDKVKEAVKHVVYIAGGIILRYRDTKTGALLR
jgi:hypothetical protein